MLIERRWDGDYVALKDPPTLIPAGEREPAKVETFYDVYRVKRGRVDRIREVADDSPAALAVADAKKEIAVIRERLRTLHEELSAALAVAYSRGAPLKVADLAKTR